MAMEQYKYETFATRDSFNSSLRHFKAVMEIIGDFQQHINIADIISSLLSDDTINTHQTAPIIQALLVDKYEYSFKSLNLKETINDFEILFKETAKWKGVDIVITYQHPELGFMAINPKNQKQVKSVGSFKKNELVTIYTGFFEETSDRLESNTDVKLLDSAMSALEAFFTGKKLSGSPAFSKSDLKIKTIRQESKEPAKPAKKRKTKKQEPSKEQTTKTKAEIPAGKKKMVGPYSVPVTNELFHNGNVEAWKRIVASYNATYPDVDVYIFYDGERIHDINTLFKWGKVKHGSAILFSVAGVEIKDIAKLQRYLRMGASHRFEEFLHGPVGKTLELF